MIESIYNKYIKNKFNVDLEFMKHLDLANVKSWQKIELQYAIFGKDLSKDDFLFFLVGSEFYENIYDLMLKCISKTDFLSGFVNSIETIELIYLMGKQDLHFSKVSNQWALAIDDTYSNISFSTSPDFDCDEYTSFLDSKVKRKYRLLTEVDKRFPLLLLQFFEKYKKSFVIQDPEFREYIVKTTTIKAKNNDLFNKLYKALMREISKMTSTGRFLN